jgi:adenine-specific DNA-methyltransferase
MSQKYEKLKTLLKELFQLDQPDLDFGFYRVMHARGAEVTQFLDKELLPQVKAAFAQYQQADKAAIDVELAKAIEQAQALGADPETLPKVKELRTRLAADAVDLDALEAEVYDHLFSFFRRYYSEGDFLSKRVYKPGVYAIPYEGEEVKLHWANADQYYIKTSEYLRDYALRLRPDDEKHPMRVHFRLVDAAEGEHGNVTEKAGKERRFKLAAENFATVEDGELVIRFTYEPDPAKQKELNAAAETAVLELPDASLADWLKALGAKHVRGDGTAAEATRLRVHLDRYTGRNTFDYFIHKDLGGFLQRELDFYIKNEVMHLDDVENESAPRVETYLSKIKVIRSIAGKIIAFLAQLEDFQKKLWLKKKFVVEASYCIRLGVIPEEFYPEIAANAAQGEEWVRLCAIDELEATAGSLLEPGRPGYSVPLSPEFLKAHPTPMVDTRHCNVDLTARLLENTGDLDEAVDGVLFHSDNFQALGLMQRRYSGKAKCIYLDPPYNTDTDGFAYKDSYEHSSWLAMLATRLELATQLLMTDGVHYCSIDDIEIHNLRRLADDHFGSRSFVGTITWKSTTQPDNIGRARFGLQQNIEYVLLHANCSRADLPGFALKSSGVERRYPHIGRFGPCRFEIIERAFEGAYARPTMQFRILGQLPREGKQWQIGENTARGLEAAGKVEVVEGIVKRAVYPEDESNADVGLIPFWAHLDGVGTSQAGKAELTAIVGRGHGFDTVKPVSLLVRLLEHVPCLGMTLDYFAGSGTSGHAAIKLTRGDGTRRRFVLVEGEAYFEDLLLPRLKKVSYAPEWKDGKPERLATPEEAERSPRIMKVVRLESYEDTLNNLELRRTKEQQGLLDLAPAQGAGKLKEQYMLRYLLDVETRGSQSLLNVAALTDPTAYKLKVKRPGSDESREVNVDLLETFNWLIGLTVQRFAAPQTFTVETERDGEGRLRLKGRLKQEADGRWWFRTVTGTTPDGRKTLVIWRKRPGGEAAEGIEQDNLILDEWFTKQGYSSKDSEFDLIYVNGDNNLENLKAPDDTWKVRLIEEDFFRLMFETEGV